jgi:hypothetical protein
MATLVDIPRNHVRLVDQATLDIDVTLFDLHRFSGKCHDAFDEGEFRILRIPKHDHIAAFDLTEIVEKLVHEDPLAVCELRRHARPLYFESLKDIRNKHYADDDRDDEILNQVP